MIINIPDEVLIQAKISPTDFRIEIAVYLYERGSVTISKARKLAGLDLISFQKELSKRNVYINFGIEDLKKDLENLKNLK